MEAVEQFTVGPEETPLVIEPGEPYSCYWVSGVSIDSFLEFVEGAVSARSETILYTEEYPKNARYRYVEAREKIKNETARFFRVNTEPFDLTWELKSDTPSIVGFIAENPYPVKISGLYQGTTGEILDGRSRLKLNDYIEK